MFRVAYEDFHQFVDPDSKLERIALSQLGA
ncbi:MAG: hypothetical protein ACI9UN_000104 [Granulosicoccus sp.]|jgi:hypothetical protein